MPASTPPFRAPPPRHPPVCPILTLGVIKPPSALVPTAQQSISTVPCLGPQCAWFHAAGACSALVLADASLAQAHLMSGDDVQPGEPKVDEKADGTPKQ